MMNLFTKAIDLLIYYRKDQSAGKPYWQDPAFMGLAMSILATVLAKYAGIDIDSDLQLKIVGSITGIGALLSPHTGIIAKKPDANTQQVKNAVNKLEAMQPTDHGAA